MTNNSREIAIIDVIKLLGKNIKYILYSLASGALLGLVIALTSPFEYKSEMSLLVDTSKGLDFGGLEGLAGIAGLNLNSMTSEEVNPEVFPHLLNSNMFFITLLNEKFYFPSINKQLTIEDYFSTHLEKSLLGHIISLPGAIFNKNTHKEINPNDSIVSFTKSQLKIIRSIGDRLEISYDKKTNIIDISFELQDPLVSSLVLNFIHNYLNDFLIDFKTKKAIDDLSFISNQFLESKVAFEESQAALANFRDSNINILHNKLQNEEERLVAKYNVAFNLYNELSKSLQKAKIKVQEKKSSIILLNPPFVPVVKEHPKRISITILTSIAFGLLACLMIVGKFIVLNKDE